MLCNRIEQYLDGLLDGELSAGHAHAVEVHLGECADCRALHASALALGESLARLPIDDPTPGYFDRAMAVAVRKRRQGDRRRRSLWSVTSVAAATALFVWLGFGILGGVAPTERLPEVTLAMETASSVNLVFSAAAELSDAQFTLALPDGLELDGYRGQRELRWTTDLRKGKNVLRLPLVAHARLTDEVVAKLEHETGSKTFRVKVRVI